MSVISEDMPMKTSKKTGLAKQMVLGLDKSDRCGGHKSLNKIYKLHFLVIVVSQTELKWFCVLVCFIPFYV